MNYLNMLLSCFRTKTSALISEGIWLKYQFSLLLQQTEWNCVGDGIENGGKGKKGKGKMKMSGANNSFRASKLWRHLVLKPILGGGNEGWFTLARKTLRAADVSFEEYFIFEGILHYFQEAIDTKMRPSLGLSPVGAKYLTFSDDFFC